MSNMEISILLKIHSELLIFLRNAIVDDNASEVKKMDDQVKSAFNAILNFQPSSKEEYFTQVEFLLGMLILPEDRQGISEQIYDKLLRMYDSKNSIAEDTN